jgi:uncharacterized damage-inducible protein DinB
METAFIDNYRLMGRYNRWINERLYQACGQLSDEERKCERGAFFGSIHRTLNHLIVTDQIWLRRFLNSGLDNGIRFEALEGLFELPASYTLDMVPYQDWAGLKGKRIQLDAAIESWLAEMPASYLHCIMRYSNSKGLERQHPAWQAMTHFFNHQTHHRSQVMTLLTQAGVDIGVTDLLALL